jgi:hypothetical protein
VSKLDLAIQMTSNSLLGFSSNMMANPLLFMDLKGDDCGLMPTQIGGAFSLPSDDINDIKSLSRN